MNERIRDIKDKLWSEEYWNNPNTDKLLSAQLNRFAELIVRECASICELNGQSYTHSFTPAKARLAESTSNHCGLMIKKHFGVEE